MTVLFLVFLLFGAAEIASFVVVAEQVGFFLALGILVVVSALGPFIVKRVGIGVIAHTQQRLGRGEVPTRELFDGFLILVGGVFICVPGFVGDALGLLLMIGPVRHLVIRTAGHRLAHRVRTMPAGRFGIVDVRSHPVGDDLPPDRFLGPGGGF